jgi:hypothetical protein
MGAWGPAIFSNDTSSDVRDGFRDHIGDGLTPEEATLKLVEEYSPEKDDLEEYCPFWLGLAAVQFQTGRLLDVVKNNALEIIRDELDLFFWKDSGELKKRKKALHKLGDQLVGPPKPITKIKKRYRSTCDWPIGTLVSYQLKSGDFVIFRVGEIHSDKGGDSPAVEFLNWKGGASPTELDIENHEILKHDFGFSGTRLLLCRSSERALPKIRLSVVRLGNGDELPWSPPVVILWKQLDDYLSKGYSLQ